MQTHGGYRLLTGLHSKTVNDRRLGHAFVRAHVQFDRPPLSMPGTTPAPSYLPTPRNSSPPPIPLPGAADAEASMTGREWRVRKSVNYAEPKLNTCEPYALVHPCI
jgi:hypothetical protein